MEAEQVFVMSAESRDGMNARSRTAKSASYPRLQQASINRDYNKEKSFKLLQHPFITPQLRDDGMLARISPEALQAIISMTDLRDQPRQHRTRTSCSKYHKLSTHAEACR